LRFSNILCESKLSTIASFFLLAVELLLSALDKSKIKKEIKKQIIKKIFEFLLKKIILQIYSQEIFVKSRLLIK
tara:strand:+ start:165 stop:386 length:222 start_codon:yes stop_codon:yes gene_type:complete